MQEGAFHLRALELGHLTLAVQPDRGRQADRKARYHDPDIPPCHAYVAFYLWLRSVRRLDALVHLARMARWNGCRARPQPFPPPARLRC